MMRCEYPKCRKKGHNISKDLASAVLCDNHEFVLDNMIHNDRDEDLIMFMLKITVNKIKKETT